MHQQPCSHSIFVVFLLIAFELTKLVAFRIKTTSLFKVFCLDYLKFEKLSLLFFNRALDVAAGLKTWRNAVATATSAAQLSMCVTMLDSCINWQRAPNVSRLLSVEQRNP